MSRTDAHAPLWVRLARHELSVAAHHAPDHVVCGLPKHPPRVRPPWSPNGKCHWEFCYTGVHVCSCWMCHAGPQHRQDNRRQRHDDRVAVRAALARWSQGDVRAFDDLGVPGRKRYW